MNDSSAEDKRIYQKTPTPSKPSQFKAKGWCETVEGYCHEAKKLTMCIMRNQKRMKRSYEWTVTINLNVELPTKTITNLWTKTCRALRKRGIVALWVREPNKANKVHYHLIIKNTISKTKMAQAIEEAMPSRDIVKWRMCIEPIKEEWYFYHYITKAKVSKTDDRYGSKRLLFKRHLKFKKYGVIGDFWEGGKSKKKLWDEIKDIEKRIAEGLAKPNVRRLAKYVHELLHGSVPLNKIERSFGHSANDSSVQDWIASLLAGEWAEVSAEHVTE